MKNSQLQQPGVIQYSKVAKILKNKRIHNIVENKKKEAKIKRQQWENSLRTNLRPKTTSYIQKVLDQKLQSKRVERNILLVHKGLKHDLIKRKKNNNLVLDLTGGSSKVNTSKNATKRSQYVEDSLY